MKPIVLQGHARSITQIKYNREGDLLFSCSKDQKPCVWYSLNGERLGTFNGHQGKNILKKLKESKNELALIFF
jgi:translation initiation factor 3 subunit I